MTDEQHYQLGFTVERMRDHAKFGLNVIIVLAGQPEAKKLLAAFSKIADGLNEITEVLKKSDNDRQKDIKGL